MIYRIINKIKSTFIFKTTDINNNEQNGNQVDDNE